MIIKKVDTFHCVHSRNVLIFAVTMAQSHVKNQENSKMYASWFYPCGVVRARTQCIPGTFLLFPTIQFLGNNPASNQQIQVDEVSLPPGHLQLSCTYFDRYRLSSRQESLKLNRFMDSSFIFVRCIVTVSVYDLIL